MSERVLVRGAFGGALRQTGPRRLEADMSHGFLTSLMLVPAMLLGLASVFLLGSQAGRSGVPLPALAGALMGLALAIALIAFARRRARSMGRFVIDGDTRRVRERRRGEERDLVGFDDVARATRRWDPFHRGFVPQHWLLLELKDGRRYRLAKGPIAQVDGALQLLASWGLPIAAP